MVFTLQGKSDFLSNSNPWEELWMSTEKKNPGSIKPIHRGPLKVTDKPKLTNSRNDAVEMKNTAVLCRCGGSRNKPFCDGTHVAIGFSDEKSPDHLPDRRDTYKGKKITIFDNRAICSHAGYCTDNLPGVFRMGQEPWVDPEGADVDEIIRVIGMCPSGALSYAIKGEEHRDHEAEPEIHISKNGPYRIRGGVELAKQSWHEGASREHYTLCRCGHSGNKPLCDGSHWYAAFKDDEAKTIAAAAKAAVGKAEKQWHKVAGADELTEGEVRKATVGSSILALSRVDGKHGALDHKCPHQGGPLDQGNIEDGVLRCPWHGYKFDPKTGRGIGRAEKATAYSVDEKEEGVFVELEPSVRPGWTVSHVMADTMVNWGITHVFGMVGHSNLGMAEAIRNLEESGRISYIGVRHEGAAAFACSGYAKASGKPAACLSIAGPGATNLLTGLWDAHMDRAPVLALTGQVKVQVLGPGAFQEIDLASAFESVAGFSQTVLHGSNHAELMSLALKSAIVNRNVSHLIFPDEVQVMDAGDQGPQGPEGRIDSVRISPPEESIASAMYRLWRAKRPVVIVGFGAKDGIDKVIKLAEALHAPILTTFKGKGLVPDDHPLAGGVLGRSGTPIASGFMDESDLLVVFGASFSDHTGIDRARPIIQVDFDRMALGKFHQVDSPVWGDIGVTAKAMLERLGDWAKPEDRRELLKKRWSDWRSEKARRMEKTRGRGLNSAFVFDVMSRVTPDDAVIAVDVGNNTYSFGRYFECRNQSILMSGYLGSIGFAFPAAMGAWAAVPHRPIISISGDGGFGQYMGEFTTAVKYKMNITHVLLNNSELGKISKEQRNGGWPVWQTSLHNPNFAEYAELCGGRGWRVSKDEELEAALRQALAWQGPSLVEIMADPLLV